MWRKSKKVIELETEISRLQQQLQAWPNMVIYDEAHIIDPHNEDDMPEDVDIEDPEDDMPEDVDIPDEPNTSDPDSTSVVEVEKKEEPDAEPISIPLSGWGKEYLKEVFCIKNGYVFPRSPTPIEERKAQTYYIPRPDGEVIVLHDLDRYNISQLAYTAMYGKRKTPLVIIIMIILLWFLLLWGIIYIITLIFNGGSTPSTTNISDLGWYTSSVNPVLSSSPPPASTTIPPPVDPITEPTRSAPSIIKDSGYNTPPPVVEQTPPSIYESAPVGVIESYEYNEPILGPVVCPTPDIVPDRSAEISALSLQNDTLVSQLQKARSEIKVLSQENKDLRGTGFACYIWSQIEKKCKNTKNKELCSELYYNYRIDE